MSTQGLIAAVCITTALQPRTSSTPILSGINKGPVAMVELTTTGVVGDKVLDTQFHGGVDKAVYAYAEEDAAWWAAQLDEVVPPGRFGENLRTTGMDLTGAVIGERWQVGEDVVLE
ncbi:MAG TPA: MOSC domain-containing protein, partial [Euzebya sp.]|nr:MOSC domain-containing protein [Euzebya sp.]